MTDKRRKKTAKGKKPRKSAFLPPVFLGEPAEGSGLDLSEENFTDEDAPGRPIVIDPADLPTDPGLRAETLANAWLSHRAALKAQRIAGLAGQMAAAESAEADIRRQLALALIETGALA